VAVLISLDLKALREGVKDGFGGKGVPFADGHEWAFLA
jgi:hypothetical protein